MSDHLERCYNCKYFHENECVRFPRTRTPIGWTYPPAEDRDFVCGEYSKKE